jgi:hypothetical protein
MSLINDALKQAKQSQSKTPPPGAPPLPPVETKREPPSPWPLFVAAVFFGVAILIYAKTSGQKTVPAPMTNAPAPVAIELPKTNPPEMSVTNAPPVEPLPKVQGIIYDAAHPMAIVDQKTVRVGDSSGSYKVTAISRTSVTFQRADGSLTEIKIGRQ